MIHHNHIQTLDGLPLNCVGDENQPIGPTNFRLCWQVQTSHKHADLIGLDTPATAGPCIHLGEDIGEVTPCADGCGKGMRLKLFACAVHGSCTTSRRGHKGGCCRDSMGNVCVDYKPKTRFKIEVTAGGIGDSLMTLTLAQGWKNEHPEHPITIISPRCEWIELFEGFEYSPHVVRGTKIYGQILDADKRNCEYAGALARIEESARSLPALRMLPVEVIAWAEQYRGRAVVVPMSAAHIRQWPLEFFHEVINRLNAVVALPYSAEGFDGLIGRTPQEMAALISVCRIVIANDSGMAHLAGLLRKRCIVVAATDWASHVHHFYKTTIVLHGGGNLRGVTPQMVVDLA